MVVQGEAQGKEEQGSRQQVSKGVKSGSKSGHVPVSSHFFPQPFLANLNGHNADLFWTYELHFPVAIEHP